MSSHKDPEKRKEYSRQYYLKNKEKLREYFRQYRKDHKSNTASYYEQNPEYFRFPSIKARAKQKGILFDLSLEDIVIPATCPVFGLPLQRGKGNGPKPFSPSVDRIIPELGYTKGNIQIISHKANAMKQDATPEELIQFANWVLKEYSC